MSENVMKTPEFEEAELLLPWYATGKLSDAEMRIVEAWLAEHPEAAERMENVREEQHLTVVGNEAIKVPGVAALDRLMADVEAEGDARVQSAGIAAGLFERIGAFMAGFSPQAMGVAAAACLGLLIVQAAVIGTFVGERGGDAPSVYQTATGEPAPTGPMAIVQFQDTATVGAIGAFLAANNARIIAGPVGQQYIVAFSEGPDQDAVMAILAEAEVVKGALPSGK